MRTRASPTAAEGGAIRGGATPATWEVQPPPAPTLAAGQAREAAAAVEWKRRPTARCGSAMTTWDQGCLDVGSEREVMPSRPLRRPSASVARFLLRTLHVSIVAATTGAEAGVAGQWASPPSSGYPVHTAPSLLTKGRRASGPANYYGQNCHFT
jgi:hypothetical protein